jgi:uncharacterized membrane protein HdeD (DUF308 family)
MNNLANPLCDRWGSFLAIGIFLILLGTLALGAGFITTMATVVTLGLLMAAGGIALVIHSFWTPDWKGFFVQLLVGILSAVTGWLMVMNPHIGAISLTLLLSAFFIASGLFKTITALMVHVEHWGWMLLNGLITLALGILVLAQWPAASFWFIGLFIAIDLMVMGWFYVLMGFQLRKKCEVTQPQQ